MKLTHKQIFDSLFKDKKFNKNWEFGNIDNKLILNILQKTNTTINNVLQPDSIYFNEQHKLLIFVKLNTKVGLNENVVNEENISKYAVNTLTNYINCLVKNEKKFLMYYKIIGIAISNDINNVSEHIVSTFFIHVDDYNKNKIIDLEIDEILDENSYLSIISNRKFEDINKIISDSSYKINHLLRPIKANDRSILLSALMICLFKSTSDTDDFEKNFRNKTNNNLCSEIPYALESVLRSEEIAFEKITNFKEVLKPILKDESITKSNSKILKEILELLQITVIPHCKNEQSNYDIVGKFYKSFLRYAGIADVKNGIVLTPHHITTLFTKLIDIRSR